MQHNYDEDEGRLSSDVNYRIFVTQSNLSGKSCYHSREVKQLLCQV